MSTLEQDLLLDSAIQNLVKKSPHNERIERLISECFTLSKKVCENKDYLFNDQPPNCFGTVLYLLGVIREPVWVDRYSIVCFISQNCKKEETAFSLNYIISFWTEQGLAHCGLYLGEANGEGIMLHQPDTGERWVLEVTGMYIQKNPAITNVYFYGLTKENSIWLPDELELLRSKG